MKHLDPRLKMYLIIILLLLLAAIRSPLSLAVTTIFIVIVLFISKTGFKGVIENILPFSIIIFIIFAILAFFIKPLNALSWFWKCICFISYYDIFIKTTEQVDILDASAMIFHLRASSAKQIYTSITFPKRFRTEIERIRISRIARGEKNDEKGKVLAFFSSFKVLIPAYKSTRVKAKRVVKAMDDRCYDITTRRVRVNPFRFSVTDYLWLAVAVVYVAIVLYLEIRLRFFNSLI